VVANCRCRNEHRGRLGGIGDGSCQNARTPNSAAQNALLLCRRPATIDRLAREMHHGVDAVESIACKFALVRIPTYLVVGKGSAPHQTSYGPRVLPQVLRRKCTDESGCSGYQHGSSRPRLLLLHERGLERERKLRKARRPNVAR